MKKLFVLALALMLLAAPALAQTEAPGVDVTLYGNPTTGYEWTYTVDDETVLAVGGEGYVTLDGDAEAVGMGGMYQYRLEGLKAGSAVVTFQYARPWETDVTPICTTYYRVRVDDATNVAVIGIEVDPGTN